MGTSSVEIELDAIGTRVRLHVHGSRADEARSRIRVAWDWCLARNDVSNAVKIDIDVVLDDDLDAVLRARVDGGVADTDVLRLMDSLSPAVTTRAIASRQHDLLMLHAAAVTGRAGSALLVGASGAGKTTATRCLGRTFEYFTDETAGITDDHEVLVYPKPLSVKIVGTDFKEQVSPTAAGLVRPQADRAPLRGIVLLARDPVATAVEVHDVPLLEAMAALGSQSSFLASRPEPLHRLARAIRAGGGSVVQASYGEAEQLVDLVTDLVGEP